VLAAADDPRLLPDLALPIDEQRWLLALQDRLPDLTHFDLLELLPTTDARAIRRAYHALSRRLHPDAYYGKAVGPFRDAMARLFERASRAYEDLMDDERRHAYVADLLRSVPAEDSAREEVLRHALEDEAARGAEEAAAREHRRIQEERVRRLRERFDPTLVRRRKADEHHQQGLEARDAGNMAAAANHFRLAMELDPSRAESHQLWQICLGQARMARADAAFRSARRLIELGQPLEAVPHLVEAAEANPTAEHLSYAAEALVGSDPNRARSLALQALDALAMAEAMGRKGSDDDRAGLHLRLGRVFLAAGQTHTARQQLEEARRHGPHHPELGALLKSVKLT
jgi:tetratricopeptide (TPR) repeat protein